MTDPRIDRIPSTSGAEAARRVRRVAPRRRDGRAFEEALEGEHPDADEREREAPRRDRRPPSDPDSDSGRNLDLTA